MLKRIFITLWLIAPLVSASVQTRLDEYVAQGLRNNLALQQQGFSLAKSMEALKEARGLFLPTVAIQARYTRAGGGRLIEVPIGDLMNPVYGTLNALLRFHGIDAEFPTNLPNQVFSFLREKEQETKIRIIQPLFQPAIFHNYKIKSSLTKVSSAQVAVFKRQLITDIQTAYYNYVKTLNVVDLLDKTRELLEENQRVSENLFANGKATEDVIFRAQAELAGLDQAMAEAEKNKSLAAAYLNFLLNRNLDEPIELDSSPLSPLPPAEGLDEAITHALTHREEFRLLQNALEATSHQVGLAKSDFLPSVLAVVDYGIQGEKYGLGNDYDFWMASVVLEWTLFNGNRNQAVKAQAELDKKRLEVQMQELDKQIRLQVKEAYYSLTAARLAVQAAAEKDKTSQKSFTIISKKYEYGMAPHIEYLEARTSYTDAATNHILAQADYFIKKAQFERASALLDFARYGREE